MKQDDTCKDVERSIIKKYRKQIWCKFTKAINEYELIQDGDKIAVCISGGKSSMLMAKLFQELERHGKKNFELAFVVVDPGDGQLDCALLRHNADILNVPFTVFDTGNFESAARELGCNKAALGHHFDDVAETILAGMLYGAQIRTLMPKLHSADFDGIQLIRPMYLIREEDIIHWMHYNELKFSESVGIFAGNDAFRAVGKKDEREKIKQLIREMEKKNPAVAKNIFRSVENVNVDTIIAYEKDGVGHHFLEGYD